MRNAWSWCNPYRRNTGTGRTGRWNEHCTDEYKADPRLILSYHVVPGKWLLQGGTTGGGGVMRWFEHEFADYERMMKEETGASSLDQLNEIAEK